jgi:hypothetical protein
VRQTQKQTPSAIDSDKRSVQTLIQVGKYEGARLDDMGQPIP